MTPLTGEEHFLSVVSEIHGVDLSMEDLRSVRHYESGLVQEGDRRRYELIHGDELTSLYEHRIDNGKGMGGIFGTILSAGVAALTGQWWAAGLALLSGVMKLFMGEEEAQKEERFDERQGFEGGGQLAPSGGILPRIYCNRNINPAGGVRVGGILIHSRVETRRGASLLYQLYALSAGESALLGWGKMGAIDGTATLFNRQPRRNFNDREIKTYSRLGSRNQSNIPQFPYFCQSVSPPDYKVFGVDRRAKIKSSVGSTNPNPSTLNLTSNPPNYQKNAGGNAWNAGLFGVSGLGAAGGSLQFSGGTGEYAVGLSTIDQDQNWTSIQYGFWVRSDGSAVVVEGGVVRTIPFTAIGPFRVEPKVTGVEYWANGNLVYVGGVAPSYPLYPDVAIFTANGSVAGLLSTGGGIVGGSTAVTTITPTPNQGDNNVDQDILALFNSGQDYVVEQSGETTIDPKFHILDKDTKAKTFTSAPAVTAANNESIYAYWWARFETTKRCDRIDLNLVFALSARHKGGEDDKNNGKLVNHASMFDLWMRPANGNPGDEVFIMRFLVKNRGTQRIFRAIRIVNITLGRYYVELRPLTKPARGKKIYELTDNGYESDDELDNEDLPIVPSGVTMVGREVKIQGELELVNNGVGGSIYGDGFLLGATAYEFIGIDDETFFTVANPPQAGTAIEPALPGTTYTVTIDQTRRPLDGRWGLSTPTGTLLYGYAASMPGSPASPLTLTPIVNGVAQPPQNVTSFPIVLTYGIVGTNVVQSINGTATTTAIPAGQVLHPYVQALIGPILPAPVTGTSTATGGNTHSFTDIKKWMAYDGKTQISSESAPTGTIASVNEIVHPTSINKTIPTYPGIALQGYRFRASERLAQAPGTRALVGNGTECPNWIAAGRIMAGSATDRLIVNDSDFLASGVAIGHYVINLEKKITGRVTAITANTIVTNVPMSWEGAGYCGDRYAVYFIGSSCYLPDIYVDLMINDYGGIPELIDISEDIDFPSIVRSRKFCKDKGYFFDDVIEQRTPLAEWITKQSRLSYLFPIQIDGRYGLIPDQQQPIDAVFNAGNSRNFALEYPDFQVGLTNTIILRYVDGRDLFDQSGVRHRQVTITIQTQDAYNGVEPLVTEEMEARSIKNIDQAISVGCIALKTMRLQTTALSWETSYAAFYVQAGDIVSVQAPSLGIECEYSGSIVELQQGGGDWLVRLDCQPIVKSGYNPGPATIGLQGIQNQSNSIAPGFLLANRDSGESGLITAADQDSIDAAVEIPIGDEYQVLSAIQPGYQASIVYRETGNVQEIATPSTVFIDGVAWLRLPGTSEAPQILDHLNIHPKTELYRMISVQPNGREIFQMQAVTHDQGIYDRAGLVIQYDDSIISG